MADAVVYFADADNSLKYLAEKRWPSGIECPYCDAKSPMFLSTRRIWKCRSCRRQFSIKVGTIFEDSPIPLNKWLAAMWLIANCKDGISSYEISRDLGLTQKTTWFMLHRVREAMQDKTATKPAVEVEVDESFIGGKSRNLHAKRRAQVITGTGGTGKAIALVPHGSPHWKRQVGKGSQTPRARKAKTLNAWLARLPLSLYLFLLFRLDSHEYAS